MCKHFKDKECVFMSYNSIIDTKYFLLVFLPSDYFGYTLPFLQLHFSSFSTFSMSWPLCTALPGFWLCSGKGRHQQLIIRARSRCLISRLPPCWIADQGKLCFSTKFTACVDNSTSTTLSLSNLWEIHYLLAPPSLMEMVPCFC